MNEKIIFFLMCLTFLVIGFFLGLTAFGSYNAGIYQTYSMGLYGCFDGCSMATRDSNGLTNSTWVCWDECDKYINELWEKYGKAK